MASKDDTQLLHKKRSLEVISGLRQSLVDFAAKCLKIKDHNTAQIVPLNLNRGQRILHAVAEKAKTEFGRVRIILYKPRRFGGSTYIASRGYHLAGLNTNRQVMVVGHERESTDTLFDMVKLMHSQNPIAPTTLYSSKKELVFDNEKGTGLKSKYSLATAGTAEAGRSQGAHFGHYSEEAFWPNPETSLTALQGCVVKPPFYSEIWRESTANGFGNPFQVDCFKAYASGKYVFYQEDGVPFAWKSPDSDWIVVFPPWFIHEVYSLPFDSAEQKVAFAKKLEEKVFDKEGNEWVECEAKRLQVRFKLTLEQLNWRNWCIETECRGDINKFHQEYPSLFEEGFIAKGSNVYDRVLCDNLETLCEEPYLIGEITLVNGSVKVRPARFGHLTIWENPKPEEIYFITCDPGGGLKNKEQQKAQREPDPTCIDVYKHSTGTLVAQWHGHIDYDLIADLIVKIGGVYTTKAGEVAEERFIRPTAIVEIMNHGYTVVADLKRAGYPQYEENAGDPGWKTNVNTKPQMIDHLREAARDGALKIRSKETISEMRTFIEEGGKFGASQGCHDERVITAAIASEMIRKLPRVFEELKKKERRGMAGFVNWANRNKDEIPKSHIYVT